MNNDLAVAKPKLLYVDDERANLVAFRALLRDTYDVLIAENADEAFQLLNRHEIPLIVSDQRMPGMTGTELLEKVAAEFPNTARMILTGYADIDAVISAINRSRIYYYFKKPWNETEVRLTLANALESVTMGRQVIESERRFRSTFEQAGLGIAHLELEGLVLRANRHLQEFLGVAEAELVGKPLKEWFTQFDPAELLAMSGGLSGSVVREASVVTRHGERWSRLTSSISLDGKGRPDYLISLVDDLTERRQSEEQLIKLSHAVEQSPLSIIITDKDGAIEFVNPKFMELSGYQVQEVIGRKASIMKSGRTPNTIYKQLWASITSGSSWTGDLLNRKKNGNLFWERVTISPVRNKQGTITHYLAMNEDITEQNKLAEQLRQSQKMEAFGQLAGGIAHDFNNILMVILGFGHMLKVDQTLNPLQIEKIDQILQASEKAAKLTQGLLAFSRKQTLNPQNVNLNDIVQHVQRFLVRIIGEDIQLKTGFTHDPINVYVDCSQVEQVLINLATNARDAMPDGGRLDIEAELQTLDGSFNQAHRYGRPGQYAVVTVSDSGCGMDEETREKIFEPFFTTKEVGRGTGLGMAIVYGIMKSHNGFVTVYSEPGEGTVFRLYIPAIDSDFGHWEEIASEAAPRGGTETILVAEDEPTVRMLVETILKENGYTVILAEDGQDCIEKFLANRDRVSLILMDLIMPKRSGQEAHKEILRFQPGVKVLYSSGYTADFIKNREAGDEKIEIVAKPVRPWELLRKVREMLDK